VLAFVIVSLVVAVLAVIFALQNNTPTALHFLSWKFEGSLALVILLGVTAGAFMSFFAALPALLRLKWHLRSHKRRLAVLESAAGQPPAGARTGEKR
jgi:putative membrane protein